MPSSKQKHHHAAPKAFDVFKPGKVRASSTSRPVIVGHRPQVQDSTVVEKPGVPVANARDKAVVDAAELAKTLAAATSTPVPSTAETVPTAVPAVQPALPQDELAESEPEQQAESPQPVLALPASTEDEDTTALPQTAEGVEASPATPEPEQPDIQPEIGTDTALPEEVSVSEATTDVAPPAASEYEQATSSMPEEEHVPSEQTPPAHDPEPVPDELQPIDTSKMVVSTHQAQRHRTGPVLFFVLFLIFALLVIALVLLYFSGSL